MKRETKERGENERGEKEKGEEGIKGEDPLGRAKG